MSVRPGSRFHDQNPEIMQCLHSAFRDDEVWKHCVVVLTFSNMVWEHTQKYNKDNPVEEYKHYLRSFSTRFGEELVKLKVEDVRPKVIFDYAAGGSGMTSNEDTIPVIPAGLTRQDPVLPGIEMHGQSWVDEVFHEMYHKCGDDCKAALEEYRVLF